MDKPALQEVKRTWLRTALAATGMSQADLARKADNMNVTFLSAMINGSKPITDATMDKLAKALGQALPEKYDLGAEPNVTAEPTDPRYVDILSHAMTLNVKLAQMLEEERTKVAQLEARLHERDARSHAQRRAGRG